MIALFCSLIPSRDVVTEPSVFWKGSAFATPARCSVSIQSTGGFLMTAEQFWSKVDKSGECWIWNGPKGGRNYGRVFINGRVRPAHQVAWELANGKPFPAGMLACHHCDNPPCVNPDHIFVGTNIDNVLDAIKKGRPFGGPRWMRCKRGHPMKDPNLVYSIRRNGSVERRCRTCLRARAWERAPEEVKS